MLKESLVLSMFYRSMHMLVDRENTLDRKIDIEFLHPDKFKFRLFKCLRSNGITRNEIDSHYINRHFKEDKEIKGDFFDTIYSTYCLLNQAELQKQTLKDFLNEGYIDVDFFNEIKAIKELVSDGRQMRLDKVTYHFTTPHNESRKVVFTSKYMRHHLLKKFEEIHTETSKNQKDDKEVKINSISDFRKSSALQKKVIATFLLEFLKTTKSHQNKPGTNFSNDQLVLIGRLMVIFNVYKTELAFSQDELLVQQYRSNNRPHKRTPYEKYLQQNVKTLISKSGRNE